MVAGWGGGGFVVDAAQLDAATAAAAAAAAAAARGLDRKVGGKRGFLRVEGFVSESLIT